MAKIALRVYNREIESLIEGGQLDEAIAHCQHILKSFPMHVETYRLLGKAHLEGRRFADAADIFLRVLQAVPDDFVAHVGMSIIRDDETNLDDAIWHMERAFEVQPSNPAIQGELRRLYGRRDGVEPPRIRLSRDALANMYAQGELFNQAITEIRSVLAEDANRADLQVMLARAHFRAGQKVEAAEMAIQLLKKYPNCMDAMRILLDVLPGTTRSEDTQVYRPRLLVLDPYAAFVTGSVFQSDQVADSAVGLERLEYRPVTTGAPAKSDWAASLGVILDDGSKNEKAPAWLTPAVESVPVPAPAAAPDPSTGSPVPTAPAQAGQRLAPAASSGEEIPSWLSEAGWQGSSGEAKEGPMDLSDEPKDAEPLAPAEIPDWLQSMAPPGVIGAAATEPAAPPADAGGLPDWLDEMKSEIPATPAPEPEKPRPAPLDESAPVGPTGPSKPLGIEDDAMAWLESLAAKQGANPEELLTRPEDRPTEAPDTVARLSDEATAPSAPRPAPLDEFAPVGPTGPSKPLGIEDDAMAWLESLAAKQGANPEELLTRPEDRPAEAPDAVARLSEEAAVPPAEEKIFEEAAAAEPAASDDTLSSWLKNLDETELPAEAPQAAPAEALPAQAPDLPDWLKDLERPAPGAGAAAVPASDEGLPDWLSSPTASAPAEESPVWARDEAAPVVEPPAPTIPGEWVPADAAGPAEAQPAASVPVPVPAPVPASHPSPTKPTGSLARIPEKEKDADILAAAQSALNNNRLDEAIQLYIKLIKKAHLLEEVIHDLREAIYRFPVDIIVWQTLGDAYMRANRLQDALDAYTKAEELLR